MILDFSFHETMRLSGIQRWGVIEMSRRQSVAEHSYNVAMISRMICERGLFGPLTTKQSMEWALYHDLPEVASGDIPSSWKQSNPVMFANLESEMFPVYASFKSRQSGTDVKGIVKIADYVDAIQFAQKFCVDSRKEVIIKEIKYRMGKVISAYNFGDDLIDPAWLD